MKNHILNIVLLSIFFNISYSQISQQKVRINKIEYVDQKGLVSLKFSLINITNDTMYLSNKNLTIKLTKNNKSIKCKYPKVDIQPFIKPILKNGKQIQTKKEILIIEDPKEKIAANFANKLFLENTGINHKLLRYRDIIIKNIIDDCIVLLPSETYEYETYLFSKKLDKTFKVSVKYLDSKRFTYFVDENGKKIEIYY